MAKKRIWPKLPRLLEEMSPRDLDRIEEELPFDSETRRNFVREINRREYQKWEKAGLTDPSLPVKGGRYGARMMDISEGLAAMQGAVRRASKKRK